MTKESPRDNCAGGGGGGGSAKKDAGLDGAASTSVIHQPWVVTGNLN